MCWAIEESRYDLKAVEWRGNYRLIRRVNFLFQTMWDVNLEVLYYEKGRGEQVKYGEVWGHEGGCMGYEHV